MRSYGSVRGAISNGRPYRDRNRGLNIARTTDPIDGHGRKLVKRIIVSPAT